MSKTSDKARKEGIYSHVLRYTGLFGGVQGIVVLLSFVRNKFAALFLGSLGIGLIDIYNRTCNLFTAFFSLVTPVAATRSLSVIATTGDRTQLAEQVRIIRSLTLLTALLGCTVSVACSPLISHLTYGDCSHYLPFVAISPMIAMVIISGTELSILKATRELGRLAWSSLLSAVILAAVSIPSYIIGGTRAIIPALLVSTFLTLAVHLRFTLPLFPWRSNPFSWATLVKGSDLIRLSLSFILANIIASAAEFALRSIMANGGDINDVGLYSAGLVITVVASRFLFVAMDADYFPSLSGVCNSVSKTNLIANRQLEICVLLITPFLIISNLFMPLIIRILYTPDFMTIRPMVICASFYMFFKAINTPVAYIALAKNDGRTYLCMEVAYSVAFLLLVTTFYKLWGITGSGIALSLANLFEMLMVSVCYHRLYHFAYSRRAILLIFCQGLLLAAGITVVILWEGIGGHVAGTIAALASVTLSLRTLMRRSGIKGILHRRTNTAD